VSAGSVLDFARREGHRANDRHAAYDEVTRRVLVRGKGDDAA
jgi:hypothetical protein